MLKIHICIAIYSLTFFCELLSLGNISCPLLIIIESNRHFTGGSLSTKYFKKQNSCWVRLFRAWSVDYRWATPVTQPWYDSESQLL